MNKRNNDNSGSWCGIASVTLGPLLAGLFYLVVYFAPIPIIHRYFLGHPVAVVATILFFVASVGLLANFLEASRQIYLTNGIQDQHLRPFDEPLEDLRSHVTSWCRALQALPHCSLVTRIQEVLQRQSRRDTSRFLNDDLRDVADQHADASHDRLQLVRIIVWAIPMLGFLGTVIGITQTLGGLDFTDATNAVDKLKAGLYVAFDTTALGLVLSVIAIFLQYPVERRMHQLQSLLEQRSIEVLSGAFPDESPATEPLEALSEMNRAVLASVNRLVETQAELWKGTVDAAHDHWMEVVGGAGNQVQLALTEAIEASLNAHSQHVQKAHMREAEQVAQRWQVWQDALAENAKVLHAQQKSITQQNELLLGASERAKEIAEVRTLLQANTVSLGAVPEMSDAMRSLARAIDVLVQRVPASGDSPRSRAA